MNNCIFCKIAKGEIDSSTIYEDELVKAFLDINVASQGHALIIPKKHYENIYDIPEQELSRIIEIAKKLAISYKKALNIDNIQILQSSGKQAQQEIFHFHLHLIPRCKDDDLDFSYKAHPELKKNFDSILKKIKDCLG